MTNLEDIEQVTLYKPKNNAECIKIHPCDKCYYFIANDCPEFND